MIRVYQMSSEAIEATGAFPMFYGKDNLFDLMANIEHYQHVANLDVETLDEAFEVGNIGPEDDIKRKGPMHSISVGDILEKNGEKFIVARVGFEKLEEVA